MLNNIANLVNSVFGSQYVKKIQPLKKNYSNNPFANEYTAQNPFKGSDYVKNKPVAGGYFRGYYNGKPNIVGSRLLVDV